MRFDPTHADQVLAATLPALSQRIRETLGEVWGIWLFGSFARGQATSTSDIDLAVLGPRPFDAVLIFDLGLTLGVVARRDVDLVDLRRAPLVLKKEILTAGMLVANDRPAACERFTAEAMALYVAFRDELALAAAIRGSRR